MAKWRVKKGGLSNGKPFAYVDDARVDHLAGDWSNPVESLLEKDGHDRDSIRKADI